MSSPAEKWGYFFELNYRGPKELIIFDKFLYRKYLKNQPKMEGFTVAHEKMLSWKEFFASLDRTNGKVLGDAGAGKTITLCKTLTEKEKNGESVLVLDCFGEYSALIKRMGGLEIDFKNTQSKFRETSKLININLKNILVNENALNDKELALLMETLRDYLYLFPDKKKTILVDDIESIFPQTESFLTQLYDFVETSNELNTYFLIALQSVEQLLKTPKSKSFYSDQFPTTLLLKLNPYQVQRYFQGINDEFVIIPIHRGIGYLQSEKKQGPLILNIDEDFLLMVATRIPSFLNQGSE